MDGSNHESVSVTPSTEEFYEEIEQIEQIEQIGELEDIGEAEEIEKIKCSANECISVRYNELIQRIHRGDLK